MTSKTPGCQVGLPDSCTPHDADRTDLMCHHSVKLTFSLRVGFLDSLHDPSAYVTPHDISDVAIPVHKHPLTPPPGFFLSPVSRVSTV